MIDWLEINPSGAFCKLILGLISRKKSIRILCWRWIARMWKRAISGLAKPLRALPRDRGRAIKTVITLTHGQTHTHTASIPSAPQYNTQIPCTNTKYKCTETSAQVVIPSAHCKIYTTHKCRLYSLQCTTVHSTQTVQVYRLEIAEESRICVHKGQTSVEEASWFWGQPPKTTVLPGARPCPILDPKLLFYQHQHQKAQEANFGADFGSHPPKTAFFASANPWPNKPNYSCAGRGWWFR